MIDSLNNDNQLAQQNNEVTKIQSWPESHVVPLTPQCPLLLVGSGGRNSDKLFVLLHLLNKKKNELLFF